MNGSIPTPKEMHDHLMAVMRGVNAELFQALGNCVVYGPFKGMEIKQDPVWKDGNASTKLLGCYEFELTAAINKAIERKPKTIINIGCAEGYYAIGLARILIDATVFAIDVDEMSLWECREMAHKNGVVERMQFHRGCHYAKDLDLKEVPQDGRLYFVDCEGDESKLLNKTECPVLAKSDIIVECHEFLREGITAKLHEHFADTHEIEVIKPELPPLGRYPLLAEAPAVMTILAITEKRPMPTRWLACWAH
jgi:precorrin-6B methylase 2